MYLTKLAVTMLCAGMAVLGAGPAGAQNFPSKPVRIVLSTAGGSSDIAARMIAPALTASLGQPVVVENRAGQLSLSTVRTSAPDGHTLLSYGGGLWLVPMLDKSVTYDPVKDFAPITLQFRVPNVLVVHPSLPVTSVKDLIALAKAKPGDLNVAGGSPGSASDVGSAMFNVMAGVKAVRVPYAGAPPAIIALLGNQVQFMFASPSTIQPHIKSGRVRALATTGPEASPLAPDLPTVAAVIPDFVVEAVTAMYAPAGTPTAIIGRLNQEFARTLNQPDIKEKLFATGLVVSTGTPEQLMAYMKADMTRMAKIIKEGGLSGQ